MRIDDEVFHVLNIGEMIKHVNIKLLAILVREFVSSSLLLIFLLIIRHWCLYLRCNIEVNVGT